MKKLWKALVGIFAAVAMLFTGGTIAATASADTFKAVKASERTGSITINPANVGQSYSVYRMLSLEANDDYTAFRYKPVTNWDSFFAEDGVGAEYMQKDDEGYVTFKDGKSTDAELEKFAAAALKFAKDNDIAATDGPTEATLDTLKFDNLPLGYYVVESTTGALVSLTTAKPDATAKDKNEVPSVDKQVQEDSGDKQDNWTDGFGESNDAQIGEVVKFKTTIHVKKGAKNYKLHDTMTEGLSFNKSSLKVLVDNKEVQSSTNTWQLQENPDEGDTFTINFADSYVAGLENKDIVVEYTATVTKNAVIVGDSNTNDTHLDYGDNQETEHDKTTTYVWEFNVHKFTNGKDNQKINLAGATFKLSTDEAGSNVLKFTQVNAGDNANADEYCLDTKNGQETFTTPTSGKVHLYGLDSGTYYLTETKAPSGYNKLANAIKVVIDNQGNVYVDNSTEAAADKTVEVENNAGSELPGTGGMGTTVLYAAGAVIVIAAALGLTVVLRKRQSLR